MNQIMLERPRTPEERAERDRKLFRQSGEAFAAQARRTVARTIKRRARDYRDRATMLEILYPGLSCTTPQRMIAVGQSLLETSIRSHGSRIGFGGEVLPLNAKAVILLGRYLRRLERKAPA